MEREGLGTTGTKHVIKLKCGNCGISIRAADDKAGKPGKCPKCGSRVQVPGKLQPRGAISAAIGGESALSSRKEPLHANRPEDTRAVACDVCGAQCTSDLEVSSDQMQDWAQVGFSPLARIVPNTCPRPSVLYPRFAHVMWCPATITFPGQRQLEFPGSGAGGESPSDN